MVNPHPREGSIVGCDVELDMLAYFAARCPMPFVHCTDVGFEAERAMDCKKRVEWARTMLHALYPVPVPAQNSPNSPNSRDVRWTAP